MREKVMKGKENNKTGFFGNWIVRNILWAVAFFVALLLVARIGLNVITNHGQMIEVPDLTNLTFEQARKEAGRKGLKVEIVDSIFVRRMAKGAVYSQNPKAGAQVKKGRCIMLTTNAFNTKKVSMPNLVGYSMRQAMSELNSRGLALGRLIYVDDMATNNVLRQFYRNRQIKPGRQIESGSSIDLEVGLNSDDKETYVPNVKDMKYLRAVDAIHESSLNISKAVFDKSVRNYADSLNAVVYKQSPAPSKNPVGMGSGVSIYLSLDVRN